MTATMRALRAMKDDTGKVTTELTTIPIPKPGNDQVLIKIKASAVQPSDMLNAKGSFSHTTFPRTLGRDFAGVVVDGPRHLLQKEVFGTSGHTFSFTQDGAHAEYAVVPITGLCLKPAELSWTQAALIGVPCTAALQTLERGNAKAGETIVVLGGNGSVGQWVMWLASTRGLKTISVGRHGTDIISTEDPQLAGVSTLNQGHGADMVVDTVGDTQLTKAAISILADGGRLVTIAAPRDGSADCPIDMLSFYRRELSLFGCNTVERSQEQMAKLLNEELLPLIAKASDTMPQMAGSPVSIDQIMDAYDKRIKRPVILFED